MPTYSSQVATGRVASADQADIWVLWPKKVSLLAVRRRALDQLEIVRHPHQRPRDSGSDTSVESNWDLSRRFTTSISRG
jgi:hypothetical protein